jgi:hypothetical protein
MRLDILRSKIFLGSLFLLVSNDFVLKKWIAGAITGKLSDFAGLFVFAIFWSALWPGFTKTIYILSAVSFVWWKSEYSEGSIRAWNELLLFHVQRTVDYTDFLALAVLPLAYIYQKHFFLKRSKVNGAGVAPRLSILKRACDYAIPIVVLFSMTATSHIHRVTVPYAGDPSYVNVFEFSTTKDDLVQRIKKLWIDVRNQRIRPQGSDVEAFKIKIPSDYCSKGYVEATVEISKQSELSCVLTLTKIDFWCATYRGDYKARLIQIFEEQAIRPLRQSIKNGTRD